MSEQLSQAMPAPRSRRALVLACVGFGLVGLVAANIHLVYAALQSQPDCVTHLKNLGHDGDYRAARSSC